MSISIGFIFLLAKSIGLPINQEKTVLLSTYVQVHGLEVCTEKMEIRLIHDNTQKALMHIDKYCKNIGHNFEEITVCYWHP